MKSLALVIAILLSLCPKALAQAVEEKKHNHDTYMEASILHAEGKLEGAKHNINCLAIDLETYFNGSHAGLSGWSVGYRKDDLRYSDFGHALNFKLFRTIPLVAFDLKASVGVELGVPSLKFEKTHFAYDKKGKLVTYRNVFLERNLDIPWVGTKNDGAIYPFFEVGAVKRHKFFLTQVGVRGNVLKFGVDKYDLANGYYEPSGRRIIVPYGFVGVGISLR
ncbi:MAG: hypothetical protein HYT62_01410 [Candidatus Yanofskybacteria bacterium]|nr:hypothetical protein [Candidatus Yanofskybacteria bacterium]